MSNAKRLIVSGSGLLLAVATLGRSAVPVSPQTKLETQPATTQAVEKTKEEDSTFLEKAKKMGEGAGVFLADSGIGVYGIAKHKFDPGDGPLAIESRREATIAAYQSAVKKHADYLTGKSVDAHQTVSDMVKQIAEAQDGKADVALTNQRAEMESNLHQWQASNTRAVVLLEVWYDANQVTVVVGSTPKTRTAFHEITEQTTDVRTLESGIEKIKMEMRGGVVPMTGVRLLTIHDSNRVVLVGYGSSVIFAASNPSQVGFIEHAARNTALADAERELIACMSGDEAKWNDLKKGTGVNEANAFEETKEGLKKIDDAKRVFRVTLDSNEGMERNVKGKLPAGVATEVWISDDGKEARAIAIFDAQLTKMAEDIQRNKSDGSLPKITTPQKPAPVPASPGVISSPKDL